MSDTESLDYLQTGFDPATLTVPRIRSILVSHDIEYPSGAKKPQLIQIFTDNVLPQSRKILAARARARRTSKGITDADSQESTIADEEVMPPPPTPRVRSRKPSSRIKHEESESDVPTPRSPTKRTPRASSKHAQVSESETGPEADASRQRSGRKLRKSDVPPTPAPASRVDTGEDKGRGGTSRRQSAFTYDNPFQSGSSPLDGPRSVSGSSKRKSLGPSASKDPTKRKSIPSRGGTDGVKGDESTELSNSASFQIPISKLNDLVDVDENGVEAGEEFTPDEQLQLMRDRVVNGDNALGPRRPKRQADSRFKKRGPLLVATLTLLGGYAGWYRQEKLAVGYCGVGREATQILPNFPQVPSWARILVEPVCELCPQHAYCTTNLLTHCETDFLLKPHPLSLAGLVPLPPTCEPDGEKVRRVKVVADRAIEGLRERRAKWECGDLTDDSGTPETTVGIDIDQLKQEMKQEISKRRKKGMSEAEFEELWAGAIGEIEGRDEVVKATDGHRTLLTSTSLARLPLACAVRRSVRLSMARHRLQIAAVASIVLLFIYIRHSLVSRSATNAAVPNLVSLTLDRLVTQAVLHAQDRETFPENWISIGQLRDDVLRDEHSLRKREAQWAKVKSVVEMNANIRASQREGRNGEISRVWEWIGTVGGLDGEARRRSGRVSWSAMDGRSSPVPGTDGGLETVQAKWESPRPIY